jgi:ribonuclease HII
MANKDDLISAVIIDDDDDDNIVFEICNASNNNKTKEETKETKEETKETKEKKTSKKRIAKPKIELNTCFNTNPNIIEIGIDEVGRGPLFGRVYASAVILPKTTNFRHCDMKDSKKFSSTKKINQVSEYIKENAIVWSVKYEDENTIDEINILQATQRAMHSCITDVIDKLLTNDNNLNVENILLLVDGNYFKPYTKFGKILKYHTIEQGDGKFTTIAAASILAKVERDKYIEQLCQENPELSEKYKIDSNKGYGSKAHLDGIRQYGITQWHRKTFGICKNY